MKKYDFDLLMTSEEFKENQERILKEIDRQQEENKKQLKSIHTRDMILTAMLFVLAILSIVLCFHFLGDIEREQKLNMIERCENGIKESYDPYSKETVYVCK